MANSHNPGVYRELLNQFRDGYAEHGKSLFCLQAFSDEEHRALPLGEYQYLFDLAGSIALPCGSWHVWAVTAYSSNRKDLFQEVLGEGKAAWKSFRPLAARAGAHLPAAVRQALPGNSVNGESWWLNVLWWLQARDAPEHFNPQKQYRRVVSVSPFDDSARAIEACGLTGDFPEFPFQVRFEGGGKVVIEAFDSAPLSTPSGERQAPAAVPEPDPGHPSKEALALAVLADHPDWPDTKIAKKAGCNRTTLYTFKKFVAAKEILREGKSDMPRGRKFPDEGLEAWESEGD